MSHANVAIFVPHIGCPNQCSFCNQCSISGQQKPPTPDEVSAVCKNALEQMGASAQSAQIAFFGGSFTAIQRSMMLSLLEAAAPYVGENKFSGIRISTRPDAIDRERLDLLEQHHVTAIELGVQSMDDSVLEANQRGHSSLDVVNAVHLIQERKMELGLQMMTGLFQSSPEQDWNTAKMIARLTPVTVRIYPTIVLRGTPLELLYRQGRYCPPTLEESVDLCSGLLFFFHQEGIQVIRLGLHPSPEFETELLGGPYHPAFRELCESRIYYRNGIAELSKLSGQGNKFVLLVHPKAISKMVGQKKENIKRFALAGYQVRVKSDPELEEFQVVAVPEAVWCGVGK